MTAWSFATPTSRLPRVALRPIIGRSRRSCAIAPATSKRNSPSLRPRAVLALGAIAFQTYLRLLVKQKLLASRATYIFSHGAEFKLPGDLPHLFASYHPSQQNTQTGRLTAAMFDAVLLRIRRIVVTTEAKNPRR